jgi:large subunit ribosomal protein L9
MQVILLQRVEKLGLMGDTVTVRPGYARNYLLPQKVAIRANKENIAYFNQQRVQLEATNLKRKEEAQTVAKRMEGAVVTLIRQASESGQLYGSIRPRDVSDLLAEQGFIVTRNQVDIHTPIKHLGVHNVNIILHPEVSSPIRVNIALSEEEAAVQLQTGSRATKKESVDETPAE